MFTGYLAQALTNRTINSGSDNIGSYSEIAFNYANAVPHSAGIRLYNNLPVVVVHGHDACRRGRTIWRFRVGHSYPLTQSHLSFVNTFSTYNFSTLFRPTICGCFSIRITTRSLSPPRPITWYPAR